MNRIVDRLRYHLTDNQRPLDFGDVIGSAILFVAVGIMWAICAAGVLL